MSLHTKSSSAPSHLLRTQSILLPSAVQSAVIQYTDEGDALIAACGIEKLNAVDKAAAKSKLEALSDCVYVGHTNTDMDSISSAIGCAELFSGTAAAASAVNPETKACLERWGHATPPLFNTLPDYENQPVVLVDHQQTTQMAVGINSKNIKGIIDHHSLKSKTVATSGPIYIDIRPWGSACTIIAFTFFQLKKVPSSNVAGMLLSGILSDTLNLKGPTTTSTDRMMVAALARIANVKDINELANFQFNAKTEALRDMSDTEIFLGDHKVFEFNPKGKESFLVGFGVCECVGNAPLELLDRRNGLIDELVAAKAFIPEGTAQKARSCLKYSFFAIVDVVRLHSVLLICSQAELEVAKIAWPNGIVSEDEKSMDLGSRVSRKNDFIKEGIEPCLNDPSFFNTPKAHKQSKKQLRRESVPLIIDFTIGDTCCGVVRRANHMCVVSNVLVAAGRLKKGGQKRADEWINKHPNQVSNWEARQKVVKERQNRMKVKVERKVERKVEGKVVQGGIDGGLLATIGAVAIASILVGILVGKRL